MSYLSDVAIMVYFESKEAIPKVLAMARAEGALDDEVLNDIHANQWIEGGTRRPTVVYNCVKWYDEYDLPQKWKAFIDWVDDASKEHLGVRGYEYLRIGEDDDDTEYYCSDLIHERNLWVERKITIT